MMLPYIALVAIHSPSSHTWVQQLSLRPLTTQPTAMGAIYMRVISSDQWLTVDVDATRCVDIDNFK